MCDIPWEDLEIRMKNEHGMNKENSGTLSLSSALLWSFEPASYMEKTQ